MRLWLLAAGAVVVLALLSGSPRPLVTGTDSATAGAPTVVTDRITGTDRSDTAAKVSERWQAPLSVLYVVHSETYQDAVVAASRAGALDAPVLLTRTDALPATTQQAIERLRPSRIVIVGGTASVSEVVERSLAALVEGRVDRVAGPNRYATAAALAAEYASGPPRVYLASGDEYADALIAATLAGHEGVPILLTGEHRLDAATEAQLRRLEPTEVVLVGGEAVVSDDVGAEAAVYSTSGQFRRLAGADRYETAESVARQFPPDRTPAFVASGEHFSDALVASALAARTGVPMLLTRADRVPPPLQRALERQRPSTIHALGGADRISDETLAAIAKAASVVPAPREPEYDGELVWQENFDGTSLDPTSWRAQVQPPGTINDEMQAYTARPKNVTVAGGTLRLTAHRERYQGADFTSGKVTTQDQVWLQGGYIVARVRLPAGQGLWPAFWSLGRTDGERWWPTNGEIDILETVNGMDRHQSGAHGGENRSRTQPDDWWHLSHATDRVNLADGQFHLYAVRWSADRLDYYLDNELMGTIRKADLPPGKDWPFNRVPHYLLLNLAVGGTWPGPPDRTTQLPATMEIDWVRAYDSVVTDGRRGR